jgi:hypothetical protein
MVERGLTLHGPMDENSLVHHDPTSVLTKTLELTLVPVLAKTLPLPAVTLTPSQSIAAAVDDSLIDTDKSPDHDGTSPGHRIQCDQEVDTFVNIISHEDDATDESILSSLVPDTLLEGPVDVKGAHPLNKITEDQKGTPVTNPKDDAKQPSDKLSTLPQVKKRDAPSDSELSSVSYSDHEELQLVTLTVHQIQTDPTLLVRLRDEEWKDSPGPGFQEQGVFDDICTHIFLDSLYQPFQVLKVDLGRNNLHDSKLHLNNQVKFEMSLASTIIDQPNEFPVATSQIASVLRQFACGKIPLNTACHLIVSYVLFFFFSASHEFYLLSLNSPFATLGCFH